MVISAIDFAAWGLAADWPSLRWLEPVGGRRNIPVAGVRLGHCSTSAMVLTCTYPRDRFDSQFSGCDPVRELAFETTYTQVNMALHQIRAQGARPDGLIESLVSHATAQAVRYRDWGIAKWGERSAMTTELASWQSGFSLDFADAYVVVHACGIGIDQVRLVPVDDLSGYEVCSDPMKVGAMHWELWPSRPELDYSDLAPHLVTS